MHHAAQYLKPSDAANRLGVSAKALRIYEKRGLLSPIRTDAGWRAYGPIEMARGAEIVALRDLGLRLGQIAKVMSGDVRALEPALAAHDTELESRIVKLTDALAKVRDLRAKLTTSQAQASSDLLQALKPRAQPPIAFDLPWPWGGERFELRDIRALNFITGPLGSGKTRLALRIAEVLPDATFVGLERLADEGVTARTRITAEPALRAKFDQVLGWLVDEGATESSALTTLVTCLASAGPSTLVIDMLEQGLDKDAQEAVMTYLRRRPSDAPPLFFLTRSNAILDLDRVGTNASIIYCPANHSPPFRVVPVRGSTGYEAVETCLGSPNARARTAGVIAVRQQVA